MTHTYNKRKLAEGDSDWNDNENYIILQEQIHERLKRLAFVKECNAWKAIDRLLDFAGPNIKEGSSKIFFPLNVYTVGESGASEPLESFICNNGSAINVALKSFNVRIHDNKCSLRIVTSYNYTGERTEYVHFGTKYDTEKMSSHRVIVRWKVHKQPE
jgi:hypothetical protein